MEAALQFAATYQMMLMLAGTMIAAPGALVIVLMFPADRQPSLVEARSPIGDGGIGFAQAAFRKWGFLRVMKFALIPLLGIAIASFGILAPAMLAAG